MKKQTAFPKILIIGQYFDIKSGAGITMTNLFTGWDKNNIAVAANTTNIPDFSVCENFYRIGNQEIERGFPFNLKFAPEAEKSGIVKASNTVDGIQIRLETNESNLESAKDKILFSTGQIHRRRRFVVSNEFLSWVNEFSPDLIYSQLASYELILFIEKLNQELKLPLVFHIMDDWPSTITARQKGIFKWFWTSRIDKALRNLFNKAAVLMSISEAMSEEYKLRYNLEFIPFHNPIDVNNWIATIEKDYSCKECFVILYAGRIGVGLQYCLIDVAEAIRNLRISGINIEFHIQSISKNPVLSELAKYDFVNLRKPVPYHDLPLVFSKADVLLLPNDFDPNSISFLRYSMPTKASEYMVSGTPVLVYSSNETAVTKHALKYKWAKVVSENSKPELENAIMDLYKNEALRKLIGSGAKEFAIKHFDSRIIRENFKNALNYQNNK